jgi:Zn-dependent peptidase ImmA (M78 family)
MNETILDVKAELEAAGLEVKPSGERSLWIAATTKDAGGGLRLSNDASTLLQQDDHWVAVFPAQGTLSYEVPGDLRDLVPLMRCVYTHYRRLGGSFKDAFKRSVSNSESYLVGRFPPEERSSHLPPSRRVEIGTDEGLKLRIEWSEPTMAPTVSELSLGKTLLWVGGELVWGQCEGARLLPTERIWIDFLEFISRVWSYLKWEESYPFGLQPRDPSLLRTEAKARWEMLEEDRSSKEEKEVTAFEQRHDLAQGFTGKDALPVVRLIREGNQMWIVSPHRMVLRPLTEVLEQLSMIGDAIASWVASSDEPRAHDAIERWQAREYRRPMDLAEIATGLSAETIRWVANAAPSEDLELDAPHGYFQLTEILAAARMMVGSLEPETVMSAISAIADLPRVNTEELDRLSDRAEGLLFHLRLSKPYAEGYTLARWLRKVLDIEYSRPVEPEELLRHMGVPVKEIDIQDDLLDTLACWGARHGPSVVINKGGRHAQSLPGRRATLAHELCHLLIDREGALPLVEVLNGRAPWRVEARARAFAAELLLPRKRAEEISQISADIQSAVEELRADYGVSREIAIRQIDNARPSLSPQQSAELERMVSSLERF